MRSVSQYMVDVDRFVRLMIELAHDIVLEASPIPLGDTRKACLMEVRLRIIQEASRIGLLAELNAAKAQLAQANKGFHGPKGAAQYARIAEEVADGSRENPSASQGRPNRGDINAVGAKESTERKAWVVQEINKLRDHLESGLCVGLLACPRQYQHGTLEHAQWLYINCTEGAEVINSASGFTHRGRTAAPSPEDEMRLTALADQTSAACILPDTMTVTVLEALKILALPPKERKMSTIYLCICPFCSKRWLVNDGTNYAFHDCIEIRKKYLPGLVASLHAKKALEAQMQADEKDEKLDALQKKSGVTRCIVPVAFEWAIGERITGDEDIFSATFQKKKLARRPNQSAPAWERAIDDRGRLSAFSLVRHRLPYAYQLLELPEAACLFQSVKSTDPAQKPILADGSSDLLQEQNLSVEQSSTPSKEPIPISGYKFSSVADVLSRVNSKKSLSGEAAKKAKESWLVWKEESKSAKNDSKPTKDKSKSTPDENKLINKMLEDAVKAWVKGEKPVLKAPEFGLEDIMAAAEKRTGINRLRPHHFDPDTMDDLLPDLIASLASSSGTAAVSDVPASSPIASTSATAPPSEVV